MWPLVVAAVLLALQDALFAPLAEQSNARGGGFLRLVAGQEVHR